MYDNIESMSRVMQERMLANYFLRNNKWMTYSYYPHSYHLHTADCYHKSKRVLCWVLLLDLYLALMMLDKRLDKKLLVDM